jgi:hypothetical protein
MESGGLVPGEEQAVRAWLVQQGFEPGDLRSENAIDWRMMTPMAQACFKGEVDVCKWLYHHGAAENISRADDFGFTPMLSACGGGHLSVCEWLYKVGAEEDISRANDGGFTPMCSACGGGHISICKWLVLSGALNRPASPAATAKDGDYDNNQGWHLDPAIVQRDTREDRHHRIAPLTCAKSVVANPPYLPSRPRLRRPFQCAPASQPRWPLPPAFAVPR